MWGIYSDSVAADRVLIDLSTASWCSIRVLVFHHAETCCIHVFQCTLIRALCKEEHKNRSSEYQQPHMVSFVQKATNELPGCHCVTDRLSQFGSRKCARPSRRWCGFASMQDFGMTTSSTQDALKICTTESLACCVSTTNKTWLSWTVVPEFTSVCIHHFNASNVEDNYYQLYARGHWLMLLFLKNKPYLRGNFWNGVLGQACVPQQICIVWVNQRWFYTRLVILVDLKPLSRFFEEHDTGEPFLVDDRTVQLVHADSQRSRCCSHVWCHVEAVRESEEMAVALIGPRPGKVHQVENKWRWKLVKCFLEWELAELI